MDTVHTSLLAATPPYALGASIRALSGFAPCAGDQPVDGDQIRKLSALSTADLSGFAGNPARAARVAEVVAGVAALDEEWLRTAPYAEARDALLHVRGVGTFTAHALLLRVLGRSDDTPLEMAQFTGVAEAVYGADPPSPQELREWYGPYVGWWAYLCRIGLGWLDRDVTAAQAA